MVILCSSRINCDLIKFDYVVDNIDNPGFFQIRVWMIISMLIVAILSPLVLSIIWHYERFGGDPRKRTVFNQLVGMLAMNIIVSQAIANGLFIGRLLFGPLSPEVTNVFAFVQINNGLVTLFILDEIIILRCLSVFLWKQFPPINNDFFCLFFHCFNYCLAFLFAIMGLQDGIADNNLIYLLQGVFNYKKVKLTANQ